MQTTALKSDTRKRILCLSTIALAIAALPLGCVAYIVHIDNEHYRWEVRRSQEDFDRQLIELNAGRTNAMYFYDTRNTDALVRQIEGRADIQQLTFELTDVSEAGMAAVATLPELRKLVLYGGRGITDGGLAMLAGSKTIEELELKNTRVTNDGLRILVEMPNLHALKIFCEPRLGTLSDAGVVHLKKLESLQSLTLTGGWATFHAIAGLRLSLPHCNITDDLGPLQHK